MSASMEHDKAFNILVITIKGKLTFGSIEDAAIQLLNSNEYPMDISTLWDLRLADISGVDAEFMNKLIETRERMVQLRGEAKIALLAGSETAFGVGKAYEIISEQLPQKMHVFKDLDEARKWLTTD